VIAQLWICPTDDCANYYGASGQEGLDLTTQMTGVKTEDRPQFASVHGTPWRHSRAQCPDCRARGLKVDRVLVSVRIGKPRPAESQAA
jgi:hypothetical protein